MANLIIPSYCLKSIKSPFFTISRKKMGGVLNNFKRWVSSGQDKSLAAPLATVVGPSMMENTKKEGGRSSRFFVADK